MMINWKAATMALNESMIRKRAIAEAMESPEYLDSPERFRALFRIAAERVNELSVRIGRQAQSGEPLGELDITNELHVIAVALANAGGVDVSWAFSGEPIDLGEMA